MTSNSHIMSAVVSLESQMVRINGERREELAELKHALTTRLDTLNVKTEKHGKAIVRLNLISGAIVAATSMLFGVLAQRFFGG